MLAISGDAARAFSFDDLDRADLARVDFSECVLVGLHAQPHLAETWTKVRSVVERGSIWCVPAVMHKMSLETEYMRI